MQTSVFDSILGLPVHPLVIHLVVVLVPLFSIMQILIVFKPKLKQNYGWVTVAGLGVASIAAFIAKESGEALAAKVGFPGEHAEAGEFLVPVVSVLFIASLYWMTMSQRTHIKKDFKNKTLPLIGKLTALIAAVALWATFQAGHSGATATWQARLSGDTTTSAETPTTDTSEVASGITLAEVATHNTAEDCWTVVDGNVYDLTKFVSQHPGGSDKIIGICGVDATSEFSSQHGGDETPENTLSNYQIGKLG